jgi:hypothetical protein
MILSASICPCPWTSFRSLWRLEPVGAAAPRDTWAVVGVDPAAVTRAVITCWRNGEVQGLEFEGCRFRRPARSSGPR